VHLIWVDWVFLIITGTLIIKNIHKYFLFQVISLCGWLVTYYSVSNYDSFIIIGSDWFDFLAIKYRVLAYKATVFLATIVIFNLLASILELLVTPRKQYIAFERFSGIFSAVVKSCILSNFIVQSSHGLLGNNILKIINSSYLLSLAQQFSDIIAKYAFMLTGMF
jgi:hypothetical protein